MPTIEDFKRWEYEHSCWVAGGGTLGFYAFLRKVKGINYRRLNLAGVTDDASAEQAVLTGRGF